MKCKGWMVVGAMCSGLALAGEPGKPESIQIQDFEDLTAIVPNRDGGQPPAFSLDDKNFRTGKQGLRIVYKNGPQGWGNLNLPARWLQWTDDRMESRGRGV